MMGDAGLMLLPLVLLVFPGMPILFFPVVLVYHHQRVIPGTSLFTPNKNVPAGKRYFILQRFVATVIHPDLPSVSGGGGI